MFLDESQSTLFGPPQVDAFRNNPNVRICATHFMDDSFVNLGQCKAGCAQRLFLKKASVPTLL